MATKFNTIISKNKKFFIIYSIVIISVIFIISLLSILGNIERKGYLSNFNYINEGYEYNFKVNYYNKTFRNSDIYGVYPYFHVKPEYVEKIEYQEGGSPFGVLYSKKKISNDEQIEVYYKLKVRLKLIVYILLVLALIPMFYFKLIKINYLLIIALNTIIYYILIGFILPSFNMLKLRFSITDIILSNLFLIIAYHLYNKKILLTIMFFIFQTFSFFVIEPISLTAQNTILLFSDIPILYGSLIEVLPQNIKIITIIVTIIYFIFMTILIFFIVKNIIKMKKNRAIITVLSIFLLSFLIFFKPMKFEIWQVNFKHHAIEKGIISSINYKINYDRLNSIKYSKEEVLNAMSVLTDKENKREISNLLLESSINSKRNIFLIFLESFYDYSHFTNLFDEDPFPEEYRNWANNSRKIGPNEGSGSFYARLTGLTASSPLYPKTQLENLEYVLPKLLSDNGYDTIALEEAGSTYNLETLLPHLGFEKAIFKLGINNINSYISTNIFDVPTFVYGFTLLGHTGIPIENDFSVANNTNLLSKMRPLDLKLFEYTLKYSALTSIEIIKIRDTILKHYPNALIIFKHDHLYPYLKNEIENSSIDDDIKNSFLNDNTPTPILIWDGTNGAYKAPVNFVSENIPMFIALNAGVTNYTNSVISLLYKEEIEGMVSSYHKYYRVTNDTLILEPNINKNSEIFKYENAQRILSQDIFQGKKHYYNLIKEITNK